MSGCSSYMHLAWLAVNKAPLEGDGSRLFNVDFVGWKNLVENFLALSRNFH